MRTWCDYSGVVAHKSWMGDASLALQYFSRSNTWSMSISCTCCNCSKFKSLPHCSPIVLSWFTFGTLASGNEKKFNSVWEYPLKNFVPNSIDFKQFYLYFFSSLVSNEETPEFMKNFAKLWNYNFCKKNRNLC